MDTLLSRAPLGQVQDSWDWDSPASARGRTPSTQNHTVQQGSATLSTDTYGVQWQLSNGLLGDSLKLVPFHFHLNTTLLPKPSISCNPQSHIENELSVFLPVLCVAPSHQHNRVMQHRSLHAMGTTRVPLDAAENLLDPEMRKCIFVLTKVVPHPGEIKNFCFITGNTCEGKC